MAFSDKVRDLGKHVAFAVNNKGTGRRGVPTAVAELSKTETASAVETPIKLSTSGNSIRALRGLKKHSIKTKN
jgi:hypothetical protein